jgi:hypothetical protein
MKLSVDTRVFIHDFEMQKNGNDLFKAFQHMCAILWNTSDLSRNTCVVITQTNMLVECARLLARPDVDAQVSSGSGVLSKNEPTQNLSVQAQRKWMSNAALGVVNNCLRQNTIDAQHVLRTIDILQVGRLQASLHNFA